MRFNLKSIALPATIGGAFCLGGYFALSGTKSLETTKQETELRPKAQVVSDQGAATQRPATLPISKHSQPSAEISLSTVLPHSLQGAGSPDALDIDSDGNLVINAKIRNLFDFYLSAIGEESLEELVARIKLDLGRLPPKAETRALDILEGYLGYKDAVDDFNATQAKYSKPMLGRPSIEEIRKREKEALADKEQLRSLRSNFLDPETSEAFYGVEDRHDAYIEKMDDIRYDQEISTEEKLQRQKEALQDMPEWFQEQELRKINRIKLNDLDRTSMSAEDYSARRLEIVGPEAAARLEALDDRRHEWRARKDTFEKSKTELEELWSDTEHPLYQEALERLQKDSFSPEEILRLQGQKHLENARKRKQSQ